MGFLGIGTGEILLILILALIIMGPGKMNDFARTMGKTVRAIKKASADLTTSVSREIEAEKNSLSSQPKTDSTVKAEAKPSTETSPKTTEDKPTEPGEASTTE